MSRTILILIVVLSVTLAGLLFYSNLKRSGPPSTPPPQIMSENVPAGNDSGTPAPAPRTLTPRPVPQTIVPVPDAATQQPSRITAVRTNQRLPGAGIVAISEAEPDADETPKSLPDLERNYHSNTNRDTRLDIIMDIAEAAAPESIKALARLFEVENDPELKVDLLDSLLGIDGFNDEKLAMLTLGVRQGLPNDVRQSAIDGLIDLEDPRAIPLLNGLLNDPDEEIRESAQDALDILQTPQELPKQ